MALFLEAFAAVFAALWVFLWWLQPDENDTF